MKRVTIWWMAKAEANAIIAQATIIERAVVRSQSVKIIVSWGVSRPN
jgi:hypothetical protein